MNFFANHILPTLIAALWQSALLALVYYLASTTIIKHPLSRRNFLYWLLTIQLIVSLLSILGLQVIEIKQFKPIFDINFTNTSLRVYLLFLLYIIGLAAHIVKVFSGVFRLRTMKFYEKPPIELRIFAQQKALSFGIGKKVSLVVTRAFSQPFTYFFWKPVIVLPFALITQLNEYQAEAIILHELAHIKSNDYLLNYLLIACEALYFYNPFIWYIANQLRLEREKNCDLIVLEHGYNPISYAETLLTIGKSTYNTNLLALGFFSRSGKLLNRIKFITKQNITYRRRPARVAFVSILIMAGLFLSIQKRQQIITNAQVNHTYTHTTPPLALAIELPENRITNPAPQATENPTKIGQTEIRIKEKISKIDDNQHIEAIPNTIKLTPVAYTDENMHQLIISDETQGASRASVYNAWQDTSGKWHLALQLVVSTQKDSAKQVFDSLAIQ